MFSAADQQWMDRALALARRGLRSTTPNPRVGCVLVSAAGTLVGEAWHQRAGEAHAEVHALRAAGEQARGSTAYVTLEPCAHFGRTPPCSNALIDAGVVRVVVAMEDPNPLVAGRGLDRLREAGIEVRCGLLADEARELNLGFVSRMIRGLPWVRLKVAASLDGRTALPDSRSQWITGAAARADGHAWRARACAILTGIGTVRDDDPQLTVRDLPENDGLQTGSQTGSQIGQPIRQPLRVLIDSRLEVDPGAKLVRAGGLLLAHALDEDWLVPGPLADKARLLQDHGVELWSSPTLSSSSSSASASASASLAPPGKVDLGALLAELARRGVNELHVEAGAGLNGSLVREARVDELLVYLAPALLGDSRAMFNLEPPETLESAKRLVFHEMVKVGDDLRILARFKQNEAK
jgi:diaminohydroxyphosphoribosylaminopyrimidine deaminase/5-amino-6-(5-phosphoribosylamino)uracil reductase